MLCAGLSLSMNNVVSGPALVVLIMTARCPSAEPSGNFEKKQRFITYETWKLHDTLGATQRGCREREREHERELARGWGSAFIGVENGGLGFLRLILYC